MTAAMLEMSPPRAAFMLALLSTMSTLILRAHTLHASPPPPLFINFWAESAKLGISLALCASSGQEPLQPLNGHLLVLAGLYTAQNYIFVSVHRYLSSNQIFQVANLRILLIALGSRVLFKRRLSLLQYLGIVLLAAACSIRTNVAPTSGAGPNGSTTGHILLLLSCFGSAAATLYNEWALKSSAASLLSQNVQLYAFGAAMNGVMLMYSGSQPFKLAGRPPLTYVCILGPAFSGLVVSWILKHVDSMYKVFAGAAALPFCAIASSVLFGDPYVANLVISHIGIVVSMLLYYTEPELLTRRV